MSTAFKTRNSAVNRLQSIDFITPLYLDVEGESHKKGSVKLLKYRKKEMLDVLGYFLLTNKCPSGVGFPQICI